MEESKSLVIIENGQTIILNRKVVRDTFGNTLFEKDRLLKRILCIAIGLLDMEGLSYIKSSHDRSILEKVGLLKERLDEESRLMGELPEYPDWYGGEDVENANYARGYTDGVFQFLESITDPDFKTPSLDYQISVAESRLDQVTDEYYEQVGGGEDDDEGEEDLNVELGG